MNVEDVKRSLKGIESVKDDPEEAHNRELDLWLDVLTAIAKGRAVDPKRVAEEAIKSQRIKFPRWTA